MPHRSEASVRVWQLQANLLKLGKRCPWPGQCACPSAERGQSRGSRSCPRHDTQVERLASQDLRQLPKFFQAADLAGEELHLANQSDSITCPAVASAYGLHSLLPGLLPLAGAHFGLEEVDQIG